MNGWLILHLRDIVWKPDLSAFAVIYDYLGTPVDPGALERIMVRLSHRGPNGRNDLFVDNIALGYWHFWTTPEDINENQPLVADDLPFAIVFDGRLDNRDEVIVSLGLPYNDAHQYSDASLVLRSFERFGERCFETLIGEFAFVIWDKFQRKLICARDSMGIRSLFYTRQGKRVIIASEPWAIAGSDGFNAELNESAVAHYFAFRTPEDGQTLFKDIYELLPAQVMVISGSDQRSFFYWQPDLSRKIRYKSDREYADHFLALLDGSVRCRMRSIKSVGVLMSGGLDSTSVASLAARMVHPGQLTTVSYVFDRFSECDERRYIDQISKQYDNIKSVQVPCDDLWPFHTLPDWTLNPNYPIANFYFPIRDRVHKRAMEEDIGVLLTGDFGDHLYSVPGDWLADMLWENKWTESVANIKLHLQHPDLRQALLNIYLRRVARRILDMFPGGKKIRRKVPPPGWLTQFAVSFLSGIYDAKKDVPERLASIQGFGSTQAGMVDAFFTNRYGLELRYPYRDRRIIEFMLAIPAYQLYRQGTSRYILRNAMQGVLPEGVRTRVGKTSLATMYFFGLQEKRAELQTAIQSPNSQWERFIDRNWITPRWKSVFSSKSDGPEKIVPWLGIAFDTWYNYSIKIK